MVNPAHVYWDYGGFWAPGVEDLRQKQGAEEAHRQLGGGVPGNCQGEGTGHGRFPRSLLNAGEVGEDGLHQVPQVGQKDA